MFSSRFLNRLHRATSVAVCISLVLQSSPALAATGEWARSSVSAAEAQPDLRRTAPVQRKPPAYVDPATVPARPVPRPPAVIAAAMPAAMAMATPPTGHPSRPSSLHAAEVAVAEKPGLSSPLSAPTARSAATATSTPGARPQTSGPPAGEDDHPPALPQDAPPDRPAVAPRRLPILLPRVDRLDAIPGAPGSPPAGGDGDASADINGPNGQPGNSTGAVAGAVVDSTSAADHATALVPGWNLVSIPEEPADPSPGAVLASIAGKYDLVFAYETCDTADPWKMYDPAGPAAGNDLAAIDRKVGFWVRMTTAGTLDASGTAHTSTTIPLCVGWNLVGYPLAGTHAVREALSAIEGKYTRVFAHDTGDEDDAWEVFDVDVPLWVDDLRTMTPGRGYWIYATEPVALVISVPPPAPTPSATPTIITPTPGPSPTPSGSPPTVSITSPVEGADVTTFTDVVGSVGSATLAGWVLDARLAGEGDDAWSTLATSTTAVSNAKLGTFDPTLQLNGLFELRLTARDRAGRSTTTSVNVVVEGDLKVGNFTLSFTDLSIPVAGIPIEVTRTYDSRDKRKGDFGVGWTLGIKSVRIQESSKAGRNWKLVNRGGFIPNWCIEPTKKNVVTATFPDGKVHKFAPVVDAPCALFSPPDFVSVGFEALPGRAGTAGSELVGIGQGDAFVSTAGGAVELVYLDTEIPVDFDSYTLTLKEGNGLTVNQVAGPQGPKGLVGLKDLNGNKLTISDSGITHNSGKGVDFERDGGGRITKITDPMGNYSTYVYDGKGDLTQVTDRVGNSTNFAYNRSHGMVDIVDPRGVRAARNDYDDDGRLVAITDALGHRTTVTHALGANQELITDRLGHQTVSEYDNYGNIVHTIDAAGEDTFYTYDNRGNELTKEDALGQVTTQTYDHLDNVVAVVGPTGSAVSFMYSPLGRISSLTDQRGQASTFSYDPRGNLFRTIDRQGSVTEYTTDRNGNKRSVTDALGNTSTFAYDQSGGMIAQVNALGDVTDFRRDVNGNLVTEIMHRVNEFGNPVAVTTTNTLDQLDRVIRITDAEGDSTSIEYDVIGNVAAEIDAMGNRTTYEFDALGNRTAFGYADGTRETVTYDAVGNVTSTTNRAGHTTTFTYDPVGRLLLTIHPDGSRSELRYDPIGRVIAMKDQNGNETLYEYDPGVQASSRSTGLPGGLSKLIDAAGNERRFGYDANGNIVSATDANGNTTVMTYNANDQITQTQYPDGATYSISYDPMGKMTSKSDQLGIVTIYEYDAVGRLTKIIEAGGGETEYRYDQLGNKIEQVDANGNSTRWSFDNIGRITRRTLPLGMFESYTYDPNDNLISKVDPNNESTSYQYNQRNQLIRKRYDDDSQVLFTYTATGRLATATDASGTTLNSYDSRDRLEEVRRNAELSLAYTYDAVGNQTSISTPSGTTSYTYDTLNRLRTVRDRESGQTHYEYDAVGNVSEITHANDVSTTYRYDTLNRLTEIKNRQPDGSVISGYTYVLAPNGARLSVAESAGASTAYEYDQLGRLIRETVSEINSGSQTDLYTYDRTGNRISRTRAGLTSLYRYDANDRLLSAGSEEFEYDNNGNTLFRRGPSGVTSFSYDFENRLIETIVSGESTQYSYDTDGSIAQLTSHSVTTDFIVDESRRFSQIVDERRSDMQYSRQYVYGEDLLSRLTPIKREYYHHDGHSSVRELTDELGEQTDNYSYDAYGELRAHDGTSDNTILYAGEQYHSSPGLYFLRSRYYSPNVGRFLTRDSWEGMLFDPAFSNDYGYANGDPINNIDPTGMFASVIGIVISVVFFGIVAAMGIHNSVWGGHASVPTECWPKGAQYLNLKSQAGAAIIQDFPVLAEKVNRGIEIVQTAPPASNYNCIAWSIGKDSQWIWSQVDFKSQPGDGLGNNILEEGDWDRFYSHWGMPQATDRPRFGASMLYRTGAQAVGQRPQNPQGFTHAARWFGTCRGEQVFESKLGSGSRILHLRDDLDNSGYGAHYRYYKR